MFVKDLTLCAIDGSFRLAADKLLFVSAFSVSDRRAYA